VIVSSHDEHLQAECLDYLCDWACKMKAAGKDPSLNPFKDLSRAGLIQAWRMDPAQEAAGVDQRCDHKCSPNEPATKQQLEALGVLQWRLDADKYECDPELEAIKQARGYTYSDLITVSPARLPGYETKIKSFFEVSLKVGLEGFKTVGTPRF
jgi:hypothetical protein